MAIEYVKLQWYKNFADTLTEASGDEKQGAGLVVLEIDDAITDHFNIPSSPEYPADAAPVSKVSGYEKDKSGLYLNPADETGTIITPDYFRLAGAKNSRDKVARIQSQISYTKKNGKQGFRSVGISFPLWFDTLMISQALGSMIRTNKPNSYAISGGRSGYPILYSENPTLLQYQGVPINKGAWLLQPNEAAVTQNTDELSQVAEVTPVKPAKTKK